MLDISKQQARAAMPKPRRTAPQAQRSINISDADWRQLRAKAKARNIPAAEFLGQLIRRELDGPPIEALSLTAQQKLEAAIRQKTRQLEAEHAVRMRQIDEEVRLRVVADGKEYVASMKEREAEAEKTEKLYRDFIGNHRWPFTVEEYTSILRVCHVDSRLSASDETLNGAFRLLVSRKGRLTGKESL